jgi:beta-N-acetylhexosaminidase
VLVDQEGGRVQRLGPPHWPRYPAGRVYGALHRTSPGAGLDAAHLAGRLIAADLAALGIDADCAPVADTPTPGAHDVIGDRALGETPDAVAALAGAMAEGLLEGGVLPIVKHVPGHGRAMADSHLSLPVVDASLEELEARDFAPFRALAGLPAAMTAHVVYRALDAETPATLSASVIDRAIRGLIGFEGLLITDDVSMHALTGPFAERAAAARAAGCDIVLHCNGDMEEMAAVAEGAGRLEGAAERRAEAALARIASAPTPYDAKAGRARFEAALSEGCQA